MKFYGVNIPNPILANLVLSVEVEELKISAGLQDRVAQAYETPVFMDFNEDFMKKNGYGMYETIDESLLPPLYIAYRKDLSEGSEVFITISGRDIITRTRKFWMLLKNGLILLFSQKLPGK